MPAESQRAEPVDSREQVLARAQDEAQAAFERFEQAAAKVRELTGEPPREPARPYGAADYFWWREGLLAGTSAERERNARLVASEAAFSVDGVRLARLIRGGSGKQ